MCTYVRALGTCQVRSREIAEADPEIEGRGERQRPLRHRVGVGARVRAGGRERAAPGWGASRLPANAKTRKRRTNRAHTTQAPLVLTTSPPPTNCVWSITRPAMSAMSTHPPEPSSLRVPNASIVRAPLPHRRPDATGAMPPARTMLAVPKPSLLAAPQPAPALAPRPNALGPFSAESLSPAEPAELAPATPNARLMSPGPAAIALSNITQSGAPPKRKRGRPRKKPLPGEGTVAPPQDSPTTNDSGSGPDTPNGGIKRKRGPGRPRKDEQRLGLPVVSLAQPDTDLRPVAKRLRERLPPSSPQSEETPSWKSTSSMKDTPSQRRNASTATHTSGLLTSSVPVQPVWHDGNDSAVLLAALHPSWSLPSDGSPSGGTISPSRVQNNTRTRTPSSEEQRKAQEEDSLSDETPGTPLMHLFSSDELHAIRRSARKGPWWVPSLSTLRMALEKLGRPVPDELVVAAKVAKAAEAKPARTTRQPKSAKPTRPVNPVPFPSLTTTSTATTESLSPPPAANIITTSSNIPITSPDQLASTLKPLLAAAQNAFIPDVVETQFAISPDYALPNCPPLAAAFDITEESARVHAQSLFRQHLMSVIATADGYTWRDYRDRPLTGVLGREWIAVCSLSREAGGDRTYDCTGWIRIEFDDADRTCVVAYNHHAVHRPPGPGDPGEAPILQAARKDRAITTTPAGARARPRKPRAKPNGTKKIPTAAASTAPSAVSPAAVSSVVPTAGAAGAGAGSGVGAGVTASATDPSINPTTPAKSAKLAATTATSTTTTPAATATTTDSKGVIYIEDGRVLDEEMSMNDIYNSWKIVD